MANPITNTDTSHDVTGTFLHPQYMEIQQKDNAGNNKRGIWDIMNDCYAGEIYVKEQGTAYLPKTPGQLSSGNPRGDEMHRAYLGRADFDDVLKDNVTSMQGLIFSAPNDVELPGVLEELKTKATQDNYTLDSLTREITAAQLTTGRIGLLIDPVDGQGVVCPRIIRYREKAILNWGVDDNGELTFVVLDESNYALNFETGLYDWEKSFRVLGVDGEGYYSYKIDTPSNINLLSAPEDADRPVIAGRKMDRIPFVFINSTDTSTDISIPIMLPVALLALSAYRISADYKQGLYFTSEPTIVISGTKVEGELRTGASSAIILPNPGSDAKYLEFSGAGLQMLSDEIERKINRARRYSAELAENGAESGTALNTRLTIKTANLLTVVLTCEAGMNQLLSMAAEWCGYNPFDVHFSMNKDFRNDDIDDVKLMAYADKAAQGLFSLEDYHKLLVDMQRTTITDYNDWFESAQRSREIISNFAPSENADAMSGIEEVEKNV